MEKHAPLMSLSMNPLVGKLISIMKAAGSVEKKGYNDFHKYSYVKEEDVVACIRALLIEHNVFLTHSVLEHKRVGEVTELMVRYTFHCAETLQTLSLDAAGQGHDKTDKGIYKALTGAHKYFLMRNFQLSAGDDPENDAQETKKESAHGPSIIEEYQKETDAQSAGSFVIPFGSKKGLTISDIGPKQASADLKYWSDRISKDGKPASGKLLDYMTSLEDYINQSMQTIGGDTQEDINY